MVEVKELFKESMNTKKHQTIKEWSEADGTLPDSLKNIDLELVERSCCFTGHRSCKMSKRELEKKTLAIIEKAIDEGYTHFISGGAVGFDTVAAEQVLFLQNAGADVTLEVVIPCNDQDKKWSTRQRLRYKQILEQADYITIRNRPYGKFCMKWRNELMVFKSSLVIAYYEEGKAGGTKNTIEFAKRHKRGVIFIK